MITVFVGTYNRFKTLERTLKSYRRLKTPHRIVVVDNGTSDPDCRALLDRVEPTVHRVYRLPGCMSLVEVANNFNAAMRSEFDSDGGDSEWYAVTDADICFDGSSPRSLDAYIRVAEHTGRPAGPHLRVTDIPAGYPLRSRVLACESRMLYRDMMQWYRGIPYSDCQIDTTFHLFPRRDRFDRLRMDPFRVGPPYDAQHLDWYVDFLRPSKSDAIYITDHRPVGSWGKQWIRDYWLGFQASPERAFETLLASRKDGSDLCNNSFMLSWAYQFGHGCDVDLKESERWLYDAIPANDNRYYWPYEEFWHEMIFDSNFDGLGWAA